MAENDACRNQMYQLRKNVLGFQFHPEIHEESLKLFLDDDEELSIFSGKYVQAAHELKKSPKEYFCEGNHLLDNAIRYVVEKTYDC